MKIKEFTDGAHDNLVDGGSQGGYFVFFAGENGKCALLSWQSKSIRRSIKSSFAAETLSMSDGVDGASLVNALLSEIYFGNILSLPVEFIIDNQSLVDALKSSRYVSGLKLELKKRWLKTNKLAKLGGLNQRNRLQTYTHKERCFSQLIEGSFI